jgi:hypothetical protein
MNLDNWLNAYHEPPDGWPQCQHCDGEGCDECEDGFIDPEKLKREHEEARAEWMYL